MSQKLIRCVLSCTLVFPSTLPGLAGEACCTPEYVSASGCPCDACPAPCVDFDPCGCEPFGTDPCEFDCEVVESCGDCPAKSAAPVVPPVVEPSQKPPIAAPAKTDELPTPETTTLPEKSADSTGEDDLPNAPIAVPVPSEGSLPAPQTDDTPQPGPAPAVATETVETETRDAEPAEADLLDTPTATDTESPLESDATTSEETSKTSELFVEPASQPVEPEQSEDPAETKVEESEPPVETTEEPSTEDNEIDDLFGPGTSEAESSEQPQSESPAEKNTEEPQVEQPAEEDENDPFSRLESPLGVDAPGGLASRTTRNWTKRSSADPYEARLKQVSVQGVTLVTPSGDSLFVPLAELADADLLFVRAQVRAQKLIRMQRAEVEQIAAAPGLEI